MSTPWCIIIFVGLFCLISAAPPASSRQKRQTIFFEDELDGRGSSNQGTSTGGSNADLNEWLSRDTRKPYWDAFGPPDFAPPAFGTSPFRPNWDPNRHLGQENHGNWLGLDYTHKHGFNGGNPHNFHSPPPHDGRYLQSHGGSQNLIYSPNTVAISEFAKGAVDKAWTRQKRQTNNGRLTNNNRLTVAGQWNQNQPGWNDINGGNSNNGPDWDRPETWLGNGQNNNGGAWNGNNQRPNGNGRNNGAWNQNWSGSNGGWNGNQRPGGNGNNGNGNNGAWNGNQNNGGSWNGNNPNSWNNNGGSWNGNNPNSWNNNGGSWNGNNNRPTQIPAGNNGNFGNSIGSPVNNNRPTPGGNSGSIRPPISINGARPPSTPAPNCDCPSTNETNPVCGDDGVTYVNPSRLRCARACGSSVRQKYYGACTATTPATNFRRG